MSGANTHDVKLLEPTLDGVVVARSGAAAKENLCADKGYHGWPARQAIRARGYVPHVRSRGEERKHANAEKRQPARRWVVERTHAWLNRFRKLLVRYEKKAMSYEALIELACALIAFRQVISIYG